MTSGSDDLDDFVEIVFIAERDTKNTVRYAEHVPAGREPRTRSPLYIKKDTLKRLGNPDRLKITLENGDFEPFPPQ